MMGKMIIMMILMMMHLDSRLPYWLVPDNVWINTAMIHDPLYANEKHYTYSFPLDLNYEAMLILAYNVVPYQLIMHDTRIQVHL
jgi:hypothetical protein